MFLIFLSITLFVGYSDTTLSSTIGLSSRMIPRERRRGNYHQLILAQQSPIVAYYDQQRVWPNTNTNTHNCGLSQSACASLLTPKRWILHGLWPFKYPRRSPTFCTDGLPEYNESSMNSSFLGRLYNEWPDFVTRREKGTLWSYEWCKHGSCVSDQESLDTVPKYFEKSLAYLNEYSIGEILENCKINPGQNYAIEEVMACIASNIQKKFRIKCFIDQYSDTKEQYLLEVRLCFNKNTLLLHDCSHNGVLISCNDRKNVTYADIRKV